MRMSTKRWIRALLSMFLFLAMTPLIALAEGSSVDVDFESGWGPFPWQHEKGNPTLPWYITNSGDPEHGRVARSGAIGPNEQSRVRVRLSVAEGEISFDLRVISEEDYDVLVFSIDEEPVGQWSGETDWIQISYHVSAGMHTFEWAYRKDHVKKVGLDAAFIDNVDFPLSPAPDIYAVWSGAPFDGKQIGPRQLLEPLQMLSGRMEITIEIYGADAEPLEIEQVLFTVLDGKGDPVRPEIRVLERRHPYGFIFTTTLYKNGIYDIWAEVTLADGEKTTFVLRVNVQN